MEALASWSQVMIMLGLGPAHPAQLTLDVLGSTATLRYLALTSEAASIVHVGAGGGGGASSQLLNKVRLSKVTRTLHAITLTLAHEDTSHVTLDIACMVTPMPLIPAGPYHKYSNFISLILITKLPLIH